MAAIQRPLRQIDALQQRHKLTAFLFAVQKKYGDDNGGALAAQLTYSMFLTVFPLLLLLLTILSVVLANDPSGRHRVLASAFGQFPIIGQQLAHNIHGLKRASTFGLVIGAVGLAYGATGVAQTGLYAMEQIWNVPGPDRPGFVPRLLRSILFLVLLGVGLVLTTFLASFGTFGHHELAYEAVAVLAAGVLNIAMYVGTFRILTPKHVGTRSLVPGAVLAGIAWAILQALGGYVVGHQLKGASALYGSFGLVLGLIAWISIGARVTLYAAEMNTVLHRRLWPRALVQPPLTQADQRSLALQALQNRRRPEQEVSTRFVQPPMTEDEFRDRHYEMDDGREGHSAKEPS